MPFGMNIKTIEGLEKDEPSSTAIRLILDGVGVEVSPNGP
jgi:hypothetical protein